MISANVAPVNTLYDAITCCTYTLWMVKVDWADPMEMYPDAGPGDTGEERKKKSVI